MGQINRFINCHHGGYVRAVGELINSDSKDVQFDRVEPVNFPVFEGALDGLVEQRPDMEKPFHNLPGKVFDNLRGFWRSHLDQVIPGTGIVFAHVMSKQDFQGKPPSLGACRGHDNRDPLRLGFADC